MTRSRRALLLLTCYCVSVIFQAVSASGPQGSDEEPGNSDPTYRQESGPEASHFSVSQGSGHGSGPQHPTQPQDQQADAPPSDNAVTGRRPVGFWSLLSTEFVAFQALHDQSISATVNAYSGLPLHDDRNVRPRLSNPDGSESSGAVEEASGTSPPGPPFNRQNELGPGSHNDRVNSAGLSDGYLFPTENNSLWRRLNLLSASTRIVPFSDDESPPVAQQETLDDNYRPSSPVGNIMPTQTSPPGAPYASRRITSHSPEEVMKEFWTCMKNYYIPHQYPHAQDMDRFMFRVFYIMPLDVVEIHAFKVAFDEIYMDLIRRLPGRYLFPSLILSMYDDEDFDKFKILLHLLNNAQCIDLRHNVRESIMKRHAALITRCVIMGLMLMNRVSEKVRDYLLDASCKAVIFRHSGLQKESIGSFYWEDVIVASMTFAPECSDLAHGIDHPSNPIRNELMRDFFSQQWHTSLYIPLIFSTVINFAAIFDKSQGHIYLLYDLVKYETNKVKDKRPQCFLQFLAKENYLGPLLKKAREEKDKKVMQILFENFHLEESPPRFSNHLRSVIITSLGDEHYFAHITSHNGTFIQLLVPVA